MRRARRWTAALATSAAVAGAVAGASAGEGEMYPSPAELMAGLTAVEGPGLEIELRNSPKKPPKGADPQTLLLQEQDVIGLLNSLRLGGAEAVGIRGRDGGAIRVAAFTGFRGGARGALQVGGVSLQPPYRLLAIGDAAAMRAELFREGGVIRTGGLDVLEMITVKEAPRILLPGAPAASPRFARAGGASEPETPVATVRAGLAAAIDRVAPRETPSQAGEALFSGAGSTRYHRPGCRFGERLETRTRVRFAASADARASGRKPCPVCIP